MKVLVVGGGAREHAILWKFAQSERRPILYAAPGNAGTSRLATNLSIEPDDITGLLNVAVSENIDLTVVGPETPLVAGIVDLFQANGLRIFGPTGAAAQIEGSKAFAKRTITAAGAPTAAFEIFDDPDQAKSYVRDRGVPIVVKADGLAAGKGVVVAQSECEAFSAIDDAMVKAVFGRAGARVVIEDCLFGQEVSVFCFTDGNTVTPLASACDYKRIYDSDLGPNTGGMGGYSPPPWWNRSLEEQIRTTCIEPVVKQMASQGTPYAGVLYGGLMLTDHGPSIIEFNARLGDPEAELILPRLENDLLDVIDAVLQGTLGSTELRWSDEQIVGVVLASGGYPGRYETGKEIKGLDRLPSGTIAFHAGTTEKGTSIVSTGGRVITIVGRGDSILDARKEAYRAVGTVDFEGKYCRSDIALLAAEAQPYSRS